VFLVGLLLGNEGLSSHWSPVSGGWRPRGAMRSVKQRDTKHVLQTSSVRSFPNLTGSIGFNEIQGGVMAQMFTSHQSILCEKLSHESPGVGY
jgi:hypothetical protein